MTRAERLKELDDLFAYYKKGPQKENVKAAKAWHSKFPPDQIVLNDQVYFQQGKVIEEPEIKSRNGFIWVEVCKGCCFWHHS